MQYFYHFKIWVTSQPRYHLPNWVCLEKSWALEHDWNLREILQDKLCATYCKPCYVPRFPWFLPTPTKTRWWFQIFLEFSPLFGEDAPILTSIFFRWVQTTNPPKKTVKNRTEGHQECHLPSSGATSSMVSLHLWTNGSWEGAVSGEKKHRKKPISTPQGGPPTSFFVGL